MVMGSLTLGGCGKADTPELSNAPATMPPNPTAPTIQALNAFYYYADVDAAWVFYRDVLGFETVADYGFAKIMRVADSSFLTLVDAERGMHSADEPKAVTLAIITEQVEGWYDYLLSQGVPMRGELGEIDRERPHNGFVAIDPEGYLLEFERFNAHDENLQLTPLLDAVQPLGPAAGDRPAGLDVQGTILWLYYDDLQTMVTFWGQVLDREVLVDQGWAKIYKISGTGFLGLVDGAHGLHPATDLAGVTVSIITGEVEEWFERMKEQALPLRSSELGNESGRVTVFVGYDPEGYFLEWDTFLDVEGNERLMELLHR